MKNRKRLFVRIVASLTAALLAASLGGCGSKSGEDINSLLDDRAESYADGRTEEDYPIVTADRVLDLLINDYADAHDAPAGIELDDDEAREAIRELIHGSGEEEPEEPESEPTQSEPDEPSESEEEPAQSEPEEPSESEEEPAESEPEEPSPSEEEPSVPEEPENEAEEEQQIREIAEEIFSYDDLKAFMKKMLLDSEDRAVFVLTGSYRPVLEDLTAILRELNSEIPLDAIGVNYYEYWFSDSEDSYGNRDGYIGFTFDFDTATLKEMKAEEHAMILEAESRIDIGDGSDYNIVDAVNRYLCDNVEYTPGDYTEYPPECHTPYLALKEGNCVCDGYARTACQMLLDFGVGAEVETGFCTNGEGHAWNIVNVDGTWYQLDVCWNDAGGSFDPAYGHEYFLVTDEYMRQTRTWDAGAWPATPAAPYAA